MKKMKLTGVLAVLFGMMVLVSCGEEGVIDPVLNVSVNKLEFDEEGGDMEISITSTNEWIISNQASSWLQLSHTAGNSGSTSIQIAAVPNATGLTRSTVLNITSPNGQDRRITVSQISTLYPSYNTSPLPPDATGMSSNAVELAAKMKLGWNIGNTMEAPGGEDGWGNPMITEEYVKFVKQQGFNAIRLPVAWDWHHIVDRNTAKIDPVWMDRVKEVVGYCVNNDMYVLLNIHWDGGWLENNVTPAKKDSVNAKQKAYWEQIATAMRDFDEHLMFAGANEPNVHDAVQMEVLHSYHQTFVNAVRATGGRNSYRVLVIQGPDTNIEKSHEMMNMPTDEIEGRMMAELHYYTPSQFCILAEDVSWGNMVYYWGNGYHSTIEPDRNATYGEEDDVVKSFGLAKQKFVDKGIPVILGEYGAYRRNNTQHVPLDLETHNNSVDHWIRYVTKKAIENGLIPFWWDTGGALDRRLNTVKEQRTIDNIVEGGK
ncbi:aryl-phospho-beta-D-glucosidase BglC (GH1 family) [Algoriphagus sp. 4150]|uniref:cellulase family glycosylhydrolase n=1 Tax=Algoriphagus sp. 4150 TaxID=2817756 RepID=UPI00286008D4|nr:cellulase family glycosylhydrolase [Algoriphagus sp. 4150]MDR7132013.1 aryl-phospho-beta-D-glucosidase BglC (GH1 family) [Algoriphagus sp. 4150]